MTGNQTYDLMIVGVLAAVLTWIATRFKIPIVWILENLLAKLKGQQQPPAPPPEPVPQPADGLVEVVYQSAPAGAMTAAGLPARQTVAVPTWLAILLQFVPVLLDWIRRLLGEEELAKGRPLTAAEKTAIAVRAGRDFYAGRLPPEAVRPAEMPAPPPG